MKAKGWLLFLPFLATVPSSSNYVLKGYDFVSGNGSGSSSSYQLKAAAGSSGGQLSSTNYRLPVGVKASLTAATPPAPTVTNTASNYDRLTVTLNVGGFPSDTKYLIAISPDSFTTTYYVHPDQTIGLTSSIADYQTYAAWGGASGTAVVGLQPSTTYQVKVAALQGQATGSGFGPTGSAATVASTVTFAVQTSLTSTPPFAVGFSLTPGVASAGDATVTATVTTNASSGGNISVKDSSSGLTSSSRSFTIGSATADLSSAATGYGAQLTGTSQGSGGPMTALSPFNSSSNNVGGLSTTYQPLASFATAVNSGSLTMKLIAKSDTTVPAAADYNDVLTLSLSLLF